MSKKTLTVVFEYGEESTIVEDLMESFRENKEVKGVSVYAISHRDEISVVEKYEHEKTMEAFDEEFGIESTSSKYDLEYFMAHLPDMEMQFNDNETLEAFIGRDIDTKSVEGIIKAAAEAEAKARKIRAQAMLEEINNGS